MEDFTEPVLNYFTKKNSQFYISNKKTSVIYTNKPRFILILESNLNAVYRLKSNDFFDIFKISFITNKVSPSDAWFKKDKFRSMLTCD